MAVVLLYGVQRRRRRRRTSDVLDSKETTFTMVNSKKNEEKHFGFEIGKISYFQIHGTDISFARQPT
jgi:hypothetical protein